MTYNKNKTSYNTNIKHIIIKISAYATFQQPYSKTNNTGLFLNVYIFLHSHKYVSLIYLLSEFGKLFQRLIIDSSCCIN